MSQDKLMPTEEMIEAGVSVLNIPGAYETADDWAEAIYLEMEAARPTTDVSTDGLVCEMCDDPDTCPAENCAFKNVAQPRSDNTPEPSDAMKRMAKTLGAEIVPSPM